MTTKDRPILFSGPMVRAILDGRKTQTRRVVKPQPARDPYNANDGDLVIWNRKMQRLRDTAPGSAVTDPVQCPYGAPGDRLWVRETFSLVGCQQQCRHRCCYRIFRADAARAMGAYGCVRWSPAIHMPRWASRLTLEIVAVRVERLQAISEADAKAEGMTITVRENGALAPFREGWDKINGKRAPWASNPWVWVVEFRRAVP